MDHHAQRPPTLGIPYLGLTMPRPTPDPANIGRRGQRWRQAKQRAFAIWGTDCWWCHHPGGYEADHLVPLSQGGDPYDPNNIRPSHGSNYPCPVCVGRAGRPRCCNQERNRRKKNARTQLVIDPQTI